MNTFSLVWIAIHAGLGAVTTMIAKSVLERSMAFIFMVADAVVFFHLYKVLP